MLLDGCRGFGLLYCIAPRPQAVWFPLEAAVQFSVIHMKSPQGYAAFVEELPGANTQGEILDEAGKNLAEAVQLVIEAKRRLAEESLAGEEAIREPLALPLM
jgi:predicted RNase H-like HicB family nuclease